MTAAEILAAAGLAESHWGKRIIAAERRGRFTGRDVDHALDWPTCACGKLDPGIGRLSDGRPIDLRLNRLGMEFSDTVGEDRFADAAEYLVAIERRAAELIAEGAP